MRKLLFILPLLLFAIPAKAQTPPVCTFAQVAFNSVNDTFVYHCPNSNQWFAATVNGTGGGTIGGGLQDPGSNGIVLRTALDITTIASVGDIISLFGGTCNSSSFLRGDGTCATVATFTYPTAGVAVSPGTSGPWSASLSFGTGPNALLQLDSSGRLPAVSAALLTNFPTLNQSTSGNAATATALAATPSLCTTGQAPTGILTNGNATGCAAIGGGSGLSNMVAGQIPVAATASTVTSSVATTGSGNVVLSTSPTLVSPALGTPTSVNLTNATFPTLNQSTSGNAATATALASTPTNCGAGVSATGVIASGNATGCFTPLQPNALEAITGATGTTSAGTFTTGANHEYIQSLLTGGSSCAANSTNKTDAITACVNTPTSGVTNAWSAGLASYVTVNDPNQGGVFGKVEGVGVYPFCTAAANNTACIGAAPQVQDVAGKTGTYLEGQEIGMIPQNTTTTGIGILMSFEGGNSQPTNDHMPAMVIQTPAGTGTWTSGFDCQAGAVAVGAPYCVEIGKIATSGASASQYILFTANNGSANIATGLNMTPGQVLANSATVPFANTSYATYFTATATLSANQLVKIDTANDNAVVVCTTSDTSCDGFVAETVITNCITSNTTCPIVTVPGSVVKGILGTGTCSRGDYVIVDTTTNGRVKCTGSIPTIGNVMGKAITAQSSVGSTLNLLTKFE